MKTIVLAAALAATLTGLAQGQAHAQGRAPHAHGHKARALEAAPAPALAAPQADGYRPASRFEQVKAQCELVANGLQPSGGFVMGSPSFVTGALVGQAVGGLIRHAQNYENCMTLNGFARAQQ